MPDFVLNSVLYKYVRVYLRFVRIPSEYFCEWLRVAHALQNGVEETCISQVTDAHCTVDDRLSYRVFLTPSIPNNE